MQVNVYHTGCLEYSYLWRLVWWLIVKDEHKCFYRQAGSSSANGIIATCYGPIVVLFVELQPNHTNEISGILQIVRKF